MKLKELGLPKERKDGSGLECPECRCYEFNQALKEMGEIELEMNTEKLADLVEETFPKGECMERGKAILLIALINLNLKHIIRRKNG